MPRSTNFLLTAAARTLKIKDIFKMGEEKAWEQFVSIRFADNNGEAYCPACGTVEPYFLKSRKKWECRGCRKHFSVTSGTIFASRKLDFTDILAAIALFVNAAKGISALQMARDLDVQHKTAWVMCHKLREAMAMGNDDVVLSGDVEIDGCHVGGHVRPENRKEDRKDRRLAENKDADRRVVIAMRERQGRTLTFSLKRPKRLASSTPSHAFSPTASCTLTKQATGTLCTPTTRPPASITPSNTATATPAPTKSKVSSRVSVAPFAASTTMFPLSIFTSTVTKLHGAKTPAAPTTRRFGKS